jgi:hypothetical protein
VTEIRTTFRETLRPAVPILLLVPLGGLMAGAAALALGPGVAVGAALLMATVLLVLLVLRAPRISVDAEHLRAGEARLPLTSLGAVEALDPAQTRAAMGPRLRADAYVVYRAWVPTAVRVELADSEESGDPTPYWLISTRRPVELVAALRSAGGRAHGVVDGERGPQAAHSEHTGMPPSE